MSENNKLNDDTMDIQIPDKMFFKIRDVAKIVDVKPHVLRYWESEFPTLNPQKNRNGQRMYTRKDVKMAAEIRKLLHLERYSIAGAKQKLKKRKRVETHETDIYDTLRVTKSELVGVLETLRKNP